MKQRCSWLCYLGTLPTDAPIRITSGKTCSMPRIMRYSARRAINYADCVPIEKVMLKPAVPPLEEQPDSWRQVENVHHGSEISWLQTLRNTPVSKPSSNKQRHSFLYVQYPLPAIQTTIFPQVAGSVIHSASRRHPPAAVEAIRRPLVLRPAAQQVQQNGGSRRRERASLR